MLGDPVGAASFSPSFSRVGAFVFCRWAPVLLCDRVVSLLRHEGAHRPTDRPTEHGLLGEARADGRVAHHDERVRLDVEGGRGALRKPQDVVEDVLWDRLVLLVVPVGEACLGHFGEGLGQGRFRQGAAGGGRHHGDAAAAASPSQRLVESYRACVRV